MREVLRQLAELEPADAPVLSIYLDMRPQATGQNPAVRSGRIVLKDRLREIEKTLGPRGPSLDSFRADAARIEQYLDEQAPSESQGLAIFACHARDLFEVVQSGVTFENQVTADRVADLFQLARLFVTRMGVFEEVGGPDDDSIHYRKRSTGGWSQARYQRHIDKHRADFARETATAIERLVDHEGAARVILAGDEVAIPPLQQALPPAVAALVHGESLRVHIRTPEDELASEVAVVLARAEAEDACTVGDRLIQSVQAGGLGVVGLERTRMALDYGQADTLILAQDAPIDDETRNALVRQATMTGAEVNVVSGHAALKECGGVGAMLRYRLAGGTP